MRLYIGMTKSKFLASSIIVSSFFVIHLVNCAQSLNATLLLDVLLKCKHYCNHKDKIFKLLYYRQLYFLHHNLILNYH